MVHWIGLEKVYTIYHITIYITTMAIEDVSGPEDAETVIMLPPYLMTRKSLIYLSELMDKNMRIISMDLPGLGTRRGERLMMSSTVSAIKDTIER